MRPALLLLLATLLSLVPRPPAGAQEAFPSDVEPRLRALVDAQLKGLNDEDPDAVMAVFHPAAPGQQSIRAALVEQFRRADHRYTLRLGHYVGLDGQYAYLRTQQQIQGQREGRPFVTLVEELLVFRRHEKEWRAWTSARLDQVLRYLDERPGGR